jgi:hypothetical protein
MNETDSEDEVENAVPVTMRPPCNTDSLVHRKKNRLCAWVKDNTLVDKDVNSTREAAQLMRREFERINTEQELWCASFEMGRGALTQSLVASREEVSKLTRDLKMLYNLTLAECGPSTRKRRTVSMRDAIAELQERKESLEAKLSEYTKLAAEAKGDKVPIVSIEIDETDAMSYLTQDMESFKKLHGIVDDKAWRQFQAATASAKAATEADAVAKSSPTTADAVKAATEDEGAASTSAATGSEKAATAAKVEVKKEKDGAAATALDDAAKVAANNSKEDLTYTLEIARGESIPSEENAVALAAAGAIKAADKKKKDAAAAAAAATAAAAAAVAKESDKPAPTAKETKKSAREAAAKEKESAVATATATADENGDDMEADADEDASKYAIRAFVLAFNAAEEAVKTASGQFGDIDVFFDTLDNSGVAAMTAAESAASSGGTSSAYNSVVVSSSDATNSHQRLVGSVDQGANAKALAECLKESRGLVEGQRERAERARIFTQRYSSGEKGWKEYLELQAGEDKGGSNGRKKRKISSSFTVKSYVYPRTPRGVPLLVSPLSQYEDKYLGAVIGGPPGSSIYNGSIAQEAKYNLPRAADSVPPHLVTEEDKVMRNCMLQSACASSETKLRRLRHSLDDWSRQMHDAHNTMHTAQGNNYAALKEDTIECKRIRRELQAFGISNTPLNIDTPLSPLTETSGWGNGGSTGSLDRSGEQQGKGGKGGGKGGGKNTGLGRGRSSGSMAALQKGNNRKGKNEWRGPPRHTMADSRGKSSAANGDEGDE